MDRRQQPCFCLTQGHLCLTLVTKDSHHRVRQISMLVQVGLLVLKYQTIPVKGRITQLHHVCRLTSRLCLPRMKMTLFKRMGLKLLKMHRHFSKSLLSPKLKERNHRWVKTKRHPCIWYPPVLPTLRSQAHTYPPHRWANPPRCKTRRAIATVLSIQWATGLKLR